MWPSHRSQRCLSSRKHGGETSSFEDLSIWHFVTPLNAVDAAEAAHVEAVQFALLFGVRCPRFAAVEESGDYCTLLFWLELSALGSPRHGR